MPAFIPVAFLDTFDTVASLPARMGLFRADPLTQYGERILTLRTFRKDSDPAEENFAWNQAYAKWPEVKNTLSQMKRIGDAQLGPPGIEYGRVFLEMLDAGAATPWRASIASPMRPFLRAHLPLRTNPGAVLYVGRESMHLFPGQLTIVEQRGLQSGVNFGEWPRIHLVADFRVRTAQE